MDEETRRVVRQAWILWAALLMGPLMFFVVVLYLRKGGQFTAPLDAPPGLYLAIVWGLTVLSAVTGFAVRSVMFRPRLRGDSIPPETWLRGYVIGWAFCEGAALFGVTLIFLTGELTPYVYPAAIAFALQVLQFPRDI